ncbi:MAG: ABC transporter substrate-binding protein [Lachnospiraceae bacterium]|nr:ABC transporter substrate-binding protein [Lachnospiraceae bacterium]
MKKLSVILCLILALSLVAGCGGSSSSSDGNASSATASAAASTDASASAGTHDDSVTIALWAEPGTVCGGFTPNTHALLVSWNIFDGLLVYEDDGSWTPKLATEWEYTEDGKDIIFTLREGVKFHNGDTVTAEDVVFSFNTIIDAGIAESMTNAMDHMEKIDDTHVKLVFKDVYGPGLKAAASFNLPIFSKSAYEADPDGFGRNPVGAGAYKMEEWKSGEYIKLTAFDDYWDGKASIGTCIFKFFDDESTASLALQNGEIDVDLQPPTSDAERLSNDENLQWLKTMGANTYWIYFNEHEGELFDNEDLRLAIAYAINKDDIVAGAINGEGKAIDSIYMDWLEGVPADYKAPTNDPEKAKEYLAKAGYPDGLEFTVVTSNQASHYKAMEIVQSQLANVGITMNLEKVEFSTWWTDIHEAGNYTMNSTDNMMFMLDMDDAYALYRGGEFLNFYGVDDPDLNAAYDAQHFNTDPEERLKAQADIVRVMGDKALVVPLYEWYNFVAADKDLKGITAKALYTNHSVHDWSWG